VDEEDEVCIIRTAIAYVFYQNRKKQTLIKQRFGAAKIRQKIIQISQVCAKVRKFMIFDFFQKSY
jgi:hypothetical protein